MLIEEGKVSKCDYCGMVRPENFNCCKNWKIMTTIARRVFGEQFKLLRGKGSREREPPKKKVNRGQMSLAKKLEYIRQLQDMGIEL